MQYISHYQSPIGNMLLAADDMGLTGLWFEGQKYFSYGLDKEQEEKELPYLSHTLSCVAPAKQDTVLAVAAGTVPADVPLPHWCRPSYAWTQHFLCCRLGNRKQTTVI